MSSPTKGSPALIAHVADTAHWMAAARSVESERPDAHFYDPHARGLAGERGTEILKRLPGGRSGSWGIVVRTVLFDELLRDALLRDKIDTVVNLAAGLDARPFRLVLPRSLRWIDVDLPRVLEFKRVQLGDAVANCRLDYAAVDLAQEDQRRELLTRVSGESQATVVLAEGLLHYLTEAQVGSLANDLAAHSNVRGWIVDLMSPIAAMHLRKRVGHVFQEAALRFAPDEGTKFFERHGFREVERRLPVEAARRLHREMPFAWAIRAMMRWGSAEQRERLRTSAVVARLVRVADVDRPELTVK
jgi:methyltransferase (TIGR00027 family)